MTEAGTGRPLEATVKFFVPAMWTMMIILIIRGLTLEELDDMEFMLRKDLSKSIGFFDNIRGFIVGFIYE